MYQMTHINDIKNDGFSLQDAEGRDIDVAANLSLKIALKAYFSTYDSVRYRIDSFLDSESGSLKDSEDIDLLNYPSSYHEACTEAIVHFQHFAELILKSLLREEHPLLADIAARNVVIFHKLLTNERLEVEEEKGIQTITFGESIDRVHKLIKAKRLGQSGNLDFIKNAESWLKDVNFLRNRLWHRGTFILHYAALDRLFGEYVLPFIQEINNLPECSRSLLSWKYQPLHCHLDPIQGIVDVFKNGEYNVKNVAILKELGRAAYENPNYAGLFEVPELFYGHKRRAKELAKLEQERRFGMSTIDAIKQCPVCGIDSLMLFDDDDRENYYHDGEREDAHEERYKYIYAVKCTSCSFGIDWSVGLPSNYGFNLENYWTATPL